MSDSHQFPDVNIDFRYPDKDEVIRVCERNSGARIDSLYDIFLNEYRGRQIFYDKEHQDLIYPEELLALNEISDQGDDLKRLIIIDLGHDYDTFRAVYRYYLANLDEINKRILFF